MVTRIDLLITSLQETVKLIQTYMLAGLGAAAFFLLLVVTGIKEVQLQAPAVGSSLPVSTTIAVAISLAVYWAAGAMASVLIDRARRLVDVVQAEDAQLLAAALSYPATPTLRSNGPRVFLAIAPAALVLYGAFRFWGKQLLAVEPFFGVMLLMIPYAVIAFELRSPLGGIHASQWRG